ncbi:MAG: aspartate aminotransferase family protein [Candidatus Nezhaarchaeota archaeon]|nr:aspartate aminotransferase family protein [Candidatus Nezhaarchaeota archaeon]MCX8141500.1 aspartate aminotransferase family protein [Candidatus Nezhaarchaeota archaeon]MDW8049767.1 aspartate aminotransferase family protein [Nitrososphaerota archaeon]
MDRDYKSIEDAHLAPTYQKLPITIIRGFGAKVWDDKGKEYVDCIAGYGAALVGHCNPKVVEAIKKQCEKLITCHGSCYNDMRSEYLEKLVKVLPKGLTRVYLCNSGAEAIEAAIKIAWRATGKRTIISMMRGYHGKTLGALSLTWDQKYRGPFEPLPNFVKFVPYGNIDKLREAMTEDVAAVVVEPIQGESGVILPPPDFLTQVRDECTKRGVLLIVDEVQTGFGRTGRLWACEHWNVDPDIMCMAKGIAGGLPMGATAARDELMVKLKVGEHTTTFGGNPLACAAASATLDVILEDGLLENCRLTGEYMLNRLSELKDEFKVIRDARGMGLMQALELRVDIRDVLLSLVERGVLAAYSGRTVIRFLPPLCLTKNDVDAIIDALARVLSNVNP